MNLALIYGLTCIFIFLLGVLVGNGYTTREQDQRDRRQAARQRELNDRG